ncbi:MAG: hypothetical protein SGJ24_19540 [Chloroflexota bacterium]|nr:hypothetical protein [Chloroflexota bacterium]
MMPLPKIERTTIARWLPALIAGAIAWVAFIVLGDTPLIRATGMALAVVGMAGALRSMGGALALVGALALAFSPAFWIQTGGTQSLAPLDVVGLVIAAGMFGVALLLIPSIRQRPGIALAAALTVFSVVFLIAIGTPRSLRVTTVLAAWLIGLLIDGALAANPRPDAIDPTTLGWRHTVGVLLILVIGIANDPLFALFVPAVALGLFLMRARLPIALWIGLAGVSAFGVWGIVGTYVSAIWWDFPAEQTPGIITHVPYLIAYAWHEPERWIKLIDLIAWQFTPIGLALGVIGLARLSRWHPPVGVVTMTAYGCYLLFGLCYFGEDAPVLLLPLLMIQVVWMTYAAYTFAAWLRGMLKSAARPALIGAAAAFALLPIVMLLRIVGVV